MRMRLSNRSGLLLVVSVLAIYSAFWGLTWKATDPCWNRSGIMMPATGEDSYYNRVLENYREPPFSVCEPDTPDYLRIFVAGGYGSPYLIRLEPDPDRPRLIFKSRKGSLISDELVMSKEEWRRLLDFLAAEGIFRPPASIWRVTVNPRPPARRLIVDAQVDGRREIRSRGEWFGPDFTAIDKYFDAFFDRNARCGFNKDGVWYCSGWHIRKKRFGL